MVNKLSSLFNKKSAADRWHEKIQRISQRSLPVAAAADAASIFPWEQLRTCTNELLGKRKWTVDMKDEVLVALIETHPSKIVALAACSHLLSVHRLDEVLRSFPREKDTAGQFCQAFVAACHGNGGAFHSGDEAWACVAVAGSRVFAASLGASSTIQAMFKKWTSSGSPINCLLQERVHQVTSTMASQMGALLQLYRQDSDWENAIWTGGLLADVRQQFAQKPSTLECILDSDIPHWQNWAAWKPDTERIQRWTADIQHDQKCAIRTKEWKAAFWRLLGPDFGTNGGIYSTALRRLLAEDRFTVCFEDNTIPFGPGLALIATTDEMVTFVEDLFSALDDCDRSGSIPALFMDFLFEKRKLSLDQITLRIWTQAKASLFERAYGFLKAIMSEDAEAACEPGSVLLAVSALTDYEELRTFLRKDIATLMSITMKRLTGPFLVALRSDHEWLAAARNFVSYRNLFAGIAWVVEWYGTDPNIGLQAIISTDRLELLSELHFAVSSQGLSDAAKTYIEAIVLGRQATENEHACLIQKLDGLWRTFTSSTQRTAALALAGFPGVPAPERAACICTIVETKMTDKHAAKLKEVLRKAKDKDTPSPLLCQRVVRIAAAVVRKAASARSSWQVLVRQIMAVRGLCPESVAPRAFTDCRFTKYAHWVRNMYDVFGETLVALKLAFAWVDRLSHYTALLNNLCAMPDSGRAMHCMYIGSVEPAAGYIVQMLQTIQEEKDVGRTLLMRHLLLSLTDNSLYAQPISEAIGLIRFLNQHDFELCQKLLRIAAEESVYIAAIQMRVWMRNESTSAATKKVLNMIGIALHLPATPNVENAKEYFMSRIADLIKEAYILDDMRIRLKRSDADGVGTVLAKFGMAGDRTNAIEDEIAELPEQALNLLAQVDDNTVEFHFPLAGNAIRRIAMGLQRDESLVLRLGLGATADVEQVCIHAADPKTDWQSISHAPVPISQKLPDVGPMCGGRVFRLGYYIMRCCWQTLRRGKCSLTTMYRIVEAAIKAFGSTCIVCQLPRADKDKAFLYRPSICAWEPCRKDWLLSSLELRLSELRLDEAVLGLLLGAVHAAATTMSSRASEQTIELLPGRPERLNDNKRLVTLLDTVPTVASMSACLQSLGELRAKYSIRAELLLSWTLNNYKGFIVSATGSLRVPNMPNVLQFVLADSPPDIAAAFAQHDRLQQRKVLFHGTSLDRLYAILCHGLKVLSNTAFQAHGAVHGEGIYLAVEPATAIYYAKAVARRASSFSKNHAAYVNKRVLLGIEYSGNDAIVSSGIHVATDPTRVLLRYIFLLPEGFKAPLANHVVPAMMSNFHTLRSGARNV